MSEEVNETINKMVKCLKPVMDEGMNSYSGLTPLKRSLSSTSEGSENGSFGETLSIKRLKSEKKFDMDYLGSPREMRRLRADLIEARNTILNLENRIQYMHSVRKQMQIMFDEETSSLKRQQEYDRKSVGELESQLQSIRKRESNLKEELSELKNNYNMLKIHKDQEVEELEKTINELKQESRLLEGEESSEVSMLQRKLTEMQIILEAAEQDAESQKKLVKELEKHLSEKNSVDRELEITKQALQNAKLKIKSLEYNKEEYNEFQEQAKNQAYKLVNYITLEKENQRLKEENVRLKDEVRNKLILEEEVYDLKGRLVNLKEQEKKLANLQVQQHQNELVLEEWRSVARGICETSIVDSSLPHSLRSVVERLQQQEIHLTSSKSELESKLKSVQHEAKVAKSELEKTQQLLIDLKKINEQKQNLIHRMQKKLLLISRERDSYRLQLDSYEKDLTMNNSNPSANYLQSQKERIDNLETIIAGYREQLAKLESELQVYQPHLHQDSTPVRIDQISRLQNEISQLKHENDRLRSRCDDLEIQLEDYPLSNNDTLKGGQVCHMAKNPLSECIAEREKTVERLQEECERLKRKIKYLEEGIETSKLNESASPQEICELKEKIRSNESQTQKLKDYFKLSMQEFRNVIYMLLGYKIDRTSTSLYKLTSMYAENSEDQLCFQLNGEGTLNLLENEFSATLEEMVALHLRHQNSIPVFLSAITMDLFNSRTFPTKTYEID